MIFFLNRGLILEQEIVKALKKYFSIIDVSGYYRNHTVVVTNEHPFARMLLSESPDKDAASLFPVVVVATESDDKPGQLASLTDFDFLTLEPDDIAEGEGGGPSPIEKRYEMMTPKKMAELRKAMDAREDKRIFGTSHFIRRRDNVSIEIWAENPQLKNELYELIRLFACGFMREYLAELYKGFFGELGEGQSPLAIFDASVRGQRSNNFNVDFGIELHGAHIAFEADYIIEQSVIDTDLVDTDNLLVEVINHVEAHEETTREWVVKPERPPGDARSGGTPGVGERGGGGAGDPGTGTAGTGDGANGGACGGSGGHGEPGSVGTGGNAGNADSGGSAPGQPAATGTGGTGEARCSPAVDRGSVP